MNKEVTSLRKQFLSRLAVVLTLIVLAAGVLQILFIKRQIENHLREESELLSQSIEYGIEATEMAAQAIEHQIDLKLLSYAYHIGDLLKGKKWKDIRNEELVQIKEKLHLSGITILAEQGGDIVGVRATDPKEIGFSFKKIGYIKGYNDMKGLLNGKTPDSLVSYAEKHAFVLPIAQSGSHEDNPQFYKYAYYVIPGTDYIIDPYIEANEVYRFTTQVGPQTWIEKVTQNNPYLIEIAVLNPQVFKNPELEKKLYPPRKKVLYGTFNLLSSEDHGLLVGMADEMNPQKTNYIQSINGKKVYKLFIPFDKECVIYAALDYDKTISPLYKQSVILIILGFAAIVALFLSTARFFNRIYENIQKIKRQIKLLESKDFTAKSNVNDGSELGDLSESANRMVDTLHRVLEETSEQASKVQRLSLMLENDANQSVEKMYTISLETTMKQREIVENILDFLDRVEEQLKLNLNDKNAELLKEIDKIREFAKERATTTTNFTITLSDLLSSLHAQSKELADISNSLFQNVHQFKL